MKIIKNELKELLPKIKASNPKKPKIYYKSKLETFVKNDPILSLFEFSNDNKAVASASIGQVYKATLKDGRVLEGVLGKKMGRYWG